MNRIVSIRTKQLWDPFPDTSYLESPDFEDRCRRYRNGDFGFVGIRAEAEVVVHGVCQTITSGGLSGIESDSARSYVSEVEEEELQELKAILQSLGFSDGQLPVPR